MNISKYFLLISTFFLPSLVSSFEKSLSEDNFPKVQYKWGEMKRFRQSLGEEKGEAHMNQLVEFEFEFEGIRTTYNMNITDFEGNGLNPCKVESRNVVINFQKLDAEFGLQEDENYLAMHTFNNILVAVTSNLQLRLFSTTILPEGQIELQLLKILNLPVKNKESQIFKGKPFIVSSHYGKFVHLIFPLGMLSFQLPERLFESTKIQFIFNKQFSQSEEIFNAQIVKNYLFVATGKQGVDVYFINENSIEQIQYAGKLNLQSLELLFEMNAVDLVLDYSMNLYIADKNNGIIIYEVDETDFSKSKVVFLLSDVLNVEKIAIRGNQSLIVIGTQTTTTQEEVEESRYFVKEIFYDIESKNYFINREFIDKEIRWRYVSMGDLFTFIQGSGVHKILYQGVNKQLLPQEDYASDFRNGIALQEMNFYEVKQIQNIPMRLPSFLAISDKVFNSQNYSNDILSIDLSEVPPKLICKANNTNQRGSNQMTLIFNSTDCKLAQYHNPILHNVWQMCQTDFTFKFIAHEIWIDSSNFLIPTLVALVVVLSLIIVIISVIFLLNKYKSQIKNLQGEMRNNQRYSHLQQQTEISENDKSNNRPFQPIPRNFDGIQQMKPSSFIPFQDSDL